jgi:sugar/nucleoside kinase (ribokinase family)
MPKPFDILMAGEINPDLILSGDVEPVFGQVEKWIDRAEMTIGSSSAIAACGAATLGLKVAFVGICGDDLFGHFMLHAMQAKGIDVSAVSVRKDQSTGISVILNRQTDRAILTFAGLIPALQAEHISDELLRLARHLHVASYFLQTQLQAGIVSLFKRAHGLGLTVSLDTNWDPSGEWQGFDQLLPYVDVFLPNENEALALTHTEHVDEALTRLGHLCPAVAIKQGASGAVAYQQGVLARVEALSMQVVDTVGAGDSFDSGFLYGYLHQWPVGKSLRLASVCGSLSTQAAGGTNAQPTYEEAMHYVRE